MAMLKSNPILAREVVRLPTYITCYLLTAAPRILLFVTLREALYVFRMCTNVCLSSYSKQQICGLASHRVYRSL